MIFTNQEKPTKNNICAIVVTYHPDKEFHNRIKMIQEQVKSIVDNHSDEECQEMLTAISKELNIKLIRNNKNLGIATALNRGFSYAVDCPDNYKWCLTMDQDTQVFPEMVVSLISAYEECTFQNIVGIIGSNYRDWSTDRVLFQSTNSDQKWVEVEHLPTSGSLTSLPIYRALGKFRDEFFIDYVDTEYCFRLKEMGYRIIISPKVGMKHPQGYYKPNKIHKILFDKTLVSNYPPIRHYYWTRNGMILVRERFWKDTNWCLRETYYLLIRRIGSVIMFEEQKLLKLKNIFYGLFDATIRRHK